MHLFLLRLKILLASLFFEALLFGWSSLAQLFLVFLVLYFLCFVSLFLLFLVLLLVFACVHLAPRVLALLAHTLRQLHLGDTVQDREARLQTLECGLVLVRIDQDSRTHEQRIFVVDSLVCDMQVEQRIAVLLEHLGDVLVDQLVADFVALGQRDQAVLNLGVVRQVFKFYLRHELREVLKLSHRLLLLRRLSQEELDGDGRGHARVGVREPNWDVDCEHVVRRLEPLGEQRADRAMSAHHLHLEQGVEAVLSAAGVIGEF